MESSSAHSCKSYEQQAGDAVKALQALLKHIGVCNGQMEDGAMRVDLNVSVVPRGAVIGGGVMEAYAAEQMLRTD